MHKMRLLLAVLLAQFIPSAALSQNNLDGAKSVIAGIMAQIENNLIQKEGIEMNYTVWKANFDNYKPKLDELNGRFTELNGYCQGTYETEEYNRRVAYCDATGAQLETLKAQLLPELDNLTAQYNDLQRRDTDRIAAFDAINGQMTPALTQLVAACATLSAEENRASCQLLPAPGPRTVDMVNQINLDLAGKVAQP